MKEYEHIANGPVLWAITFVAVGLILAQTILFLKKSFKAGKEMGILKEDMKTAFITGTISSIGPSVVVVIGMVSLLIIVGGPTALMRLAYIGNITYELLAVEYAADAYGVALTDSVIPAEVFSTALWAMAIGCVGWILVTALITHRMDTFKNKLAGGKASLIPIISTGAMLGAYGYLNAGYVISLDSNTVALVSGFFIMLILTLAYKKFKKKWINEWGLTIAMVGGVFAAVLL